MQRTLDHLQAKISKQNSNSDVGDVDEKSETTGSLAVAGSG